MNEGALIHARTIASRMHATMPRHVDLDDVIQDAYLGLCDAARRWDPSRSTLQTFATRRIAGAIIDGQRRADHLTRGQRQRDPDAKQPLVTDFTNVTGPPAPDHADEVCTTVAVTAAVARLPDRLRRLLFELFWAERPVTQLVDQFGVSERRIYQLRDRALQACASRLDEEAP